MNDVAGASRVTAVLPNATLNIGRIDDQMIASMRLVLASSGLLISRLAPSSMGRYNQAVSIILCLYAIYSLALCILAARGSLGGPSESIHWMDVGWCTVLIACSGGMGSTFFFLYFLAILIASFHRGFASGWRVTLVAATLFTAIGYVSLHRNDEFELGRFLLRPIYLVVFGYMIAYWGGYEVALQRRLALLREVSVHSNPRFGVDHTIGAIMERLRAFYDADTCLFVSVEPRVGEYFLRRVNRRDAQAGTRPELIEAAVGREMLSLPSTHAVVCGRERRWCCRRRTCCAYDAVKGEPTSEFRTYIESLAVMFDTSSFVSVPVRYRGDTMGRIYLAARGGCSFHKADADFIFQVIEHIMPIIDNIRLVDRLASDAAEVERQKIALDIHDSIIQPYIGLQIALHGILQKLGPYEVAHASDVERVIQMSEIGVADLRAYVRQLKDAGEREGSLLPAVRRYTVKFAEATGIIVQVEAEPHIRVRDRLAAQVVQMIAEGLSNIRRHTEAIHAAIKLTSCDGHLTVRIEDEGVQGAVLSSAASFTPCSITERATALGGQVQIERRQDGGSAVIVEIPL